MLELPKRGGGSEPQGRIPPALKAEAVGEAAAHDLTVFTEVDGTQAHTPRNGDAQSGPWACILAIPHSLARLTCQGKTIPVYLLGGAIKPALLLVAPA